MSKKIRWAALLLIPAVVGLVVWLLHFEAAARYRANMEMRLPEISVVIRTLVAGIPEAPADQIYDRTPKEAGITVPEGVIIEGVTEATDAGEYEVTLRLEDPETSEWEDGTKEEKKIRWRILPRPVPIPTASDLEHVYSGEVKRPSISGLDDEYAEAVGTTETGDAGWHTLAFRLKDPANTKWEDGTINDVPVSWLVGVCRISETLYPSVTEAFQTNLSGEDHPVEMLCHWTENAVNADGEDWFSLNGFSLSSDGVTLENRGTLYLVGGGPVRSEGDGTRDHACVRNYGIVHVNAGEFETNYTGSATGGAEAYALWSTDGTMIVRGGTFLVNGGTLAADGIYAEGGDITVNGGTFRVENAGQGHGAYVLWMDGGRANVMNGNFECCAALDMTRGYRVTEGILVLSGGTTVVTAGSGKAATIAGVSGSGKVRMTGGTHSVTGYAGGSGFSASDGGTLEISGGTATVRQSAGNGETVDGILVSGGTLAMSGGEITLYSDASAGTSGIGVSSGSAVVTGGTVSVELSGTARAYGVNTKDGNCTVEQLTLSVSALSGRAYGFIKSSAGTLEVRTGEFFVAGSYASTGEGNSASSKIITPPANVNCAFTIQYKTGWSAGTNWTNLPYVRSAEQIRSRGLLSGSAGKAQEGETFRYGSLFVDRGFFRLSFSAFGTEATAPCVETLLGTFEVAPGIWEIEETAADPEGTKLLILQSAETGGEIKTGEGAEVIQYERVLLGTAGSEAGGFLLFSTREEADELRRTNGNGFTERLAASWKAAELDSGLTSPAPEFEQTGFYRTAAGGDALEVYVCKDADGNIVRIEVEAK